MRFLVFAILIALFIGYWLHSLERYEQSLVDISDRAAVASDDKSHQVLEEQHTAFRNSQPDVQKSSTCLEEVFCGRVPQAEVINHSDAVRPNFDNLISLPVLSLQQEELAHSYWQSLLESNPDEVWNALESKPLLLKTLSHSNLDMLFEHFGQALIYCSFFGVDNLEALAFEYQSHIIELLLQLEIEQVSELILSWPSAYQVREVALLQLADSWMVSNKTGVELMDYVYIVRDEQLNQIMSDSFHSYSFEDVEQQLEWIANYDSEDIFIGNVPQLLDKLSKMMSQNEFIEYSHSSPFPILAYDIATDIESRFKECTHLPGQDNEPLGHQCP